MQRNIIFSIVIICVILIGFFLWNTRLSSFSRTSSKSTYLQPSIPPPSPTPIKLHGGKGEYVISQSAHVGPSVSRVIFDPLDAQKGQVLTISTTTSSPVDSLIGTLTTDSSELTLVFKKISTLKNQDQWQVEVKLTDTIWYQYILSITARTHDQETVVKVAPRSR
jgi:hypothetical protein